MPHRFDRAVVERDLRRRRSGSRGASDGGGRATPRPPRRWLWSLLFAPPFDQTPLDPGYIKGYPPGIRENGGQYTHARPLVGDRFCHARRRRQGRRAVLDAEPDQPRAHARRVQRYKVEPYVACADVYSMPPHVGRGGWTWYTGSAGWMYRAGLEWILGFRLQGASLLIDPCIPKTWPGFSIDFRYRSSRYDIAVSRIPTASAAASSAPSSTGSRCRETRRVFP